jgi:hypothetical protein
VKPVGLANAWRREKRIDDELLEFA